MSTTPDAAALANTVPPDVLADAQLVAECVASGTPVPLEVARRVRERSERITEQTRRTYGELDIGVPAIRELRGDLPG